MELTIFELLIAYCLLLIAYCLLLIAYCKIKVYKQKKSHTNKVV